jgi:hypothetical protein
MFNSLFLVPRVYGPLRGRRRGDGIGRIFDSSITVITKRLQ